jgi:hypothetical protein
MKMAMLAGVVRGLVDQVVHDVRDLVGPTSELLQMFSEATAERRAPM